MEALPTGHDAAVQMIDTSVVRVHQRAACIADNNHEDMGRSRGGLTNKIQSAVRQNASFDLDICQLQKPNKSRSVGSPNVTIDRSFWK
jgi:hypothetical protein